MRWILLLCLWPAIASGQTIIDTVFMNCGISYEAKETLDSADLECISNESQSLLYTNPKEFIELTRLLQKRALELKSLKLQQTAFMRLGNVHIVGEDYDSARHYYREGIKFAYRHKDSSGLAGLFMNTGVSYYNEDKPRLAVKYYKKSLEIAEALGTEKLTYQYANIGIVYLQLGAIDKFKSYAFKTLKNAMDNRDSSAFAFAYNNLGIVYKQEDDFDSAFYYYHLSRHYAEKYRDNTHLADVLTNLSNIHQKQENSDSAIYYARRLIRHARGKQMSKHYFREMYVDMAIIYMGLNKPEKTLELLDSSDLYLSSIDNANMKLSYLDVKAQAMYELGNYKEAYQLQLRYSTLNDSIKTDEKLLQLAEMEERQKIREIEQKDSLELMRHIENETVLEGDIEKKEAQNKEKDRIITYVAIFSICLLLLLALVFVLLRQRKKSQEVITRQNHHLQEKNQEITDSITYAKNLQNGLLPNLQNLKSHVSEIGLLYLPKDIVSGDFYWCYEQNEDICLFAVADCTGHGVPGAMVSVLGINGLNKSVKEKKLVECQQILDQLNDEFEQTFKAKEGDHKVRDGMDIGLIQVNRKENTIQFAGANNPLWIFRDEKIDIVKPDKQPIGNYDYREEFSAETRAVSKGDLLVLMSDGFQDQFGGDRQKKYKPKNLREKIKSLKDLPASSIAEQLHKEYLSWKGDLEQIDDVCVLIIRI